MKYTYIHETETIWSENGEIHLQTENDTIVFNASTLINDLDVITKLVFDEVKKEQKNIKKRIKQTLKNV
jgi:hypothetical protein